MNHRPRLSHLVLLLIFFLLHFPTFFSKSQALTHGGRKNKAPPNNSSKSVSALLVFGDSTVDPGNNNFVPTMFRSNFPPYGKDFPYHIPTGRFSNGRLCTDFIASYYGVKDYVPPYLDPMLSIEDLMTGVSFASAGSGFDPLTPKVGVRTPFKSSSIHFVSIYIFKFQNKYFSIFFSDFLKNKKTKKNLPQLILGKSCYYFLIISQK